MLRTRTLVAAILTLLALALSACGSDDDTDAKPTIGPDETYAAIVDVRTPEEYAEGHVDGAVNIGLADADFEAQVAALPDEGTYLVYCRSGNRSAEAAAVMRDAGLDVVDAGGLEDMTAAGFQIVT